jgi:hypothetical protein
VRRRLDARGERRNEEQGGSEAHSVIVPRRGRARQATGASVQRVAALAQNYGWQTRPRGDSFATLPLVPPSNLEAIVQGSPRTRMGFRMMKSVNGLVALVAIALSSACGAKPLPPPPPPPAPTAEPVVEAPPPPKCEALEEKCAGDGATMGKIANTELTLAPPSGWIYAQTAGALIAQTGDFGAVTAVLGYDAGDPKDKKAAEASREAAFETLEKLANIALKKKFNWKEKPQTEDDFGLKTTLFKISLWRLPKDVTRGDKKGMLVVFNAPLDGTKMLLGIAFVGDDDTTSPDLILKSIDSLAKGDK